MMILQVISLVILLLYVLLITAITIGWWRLKNFKNHQLPTEIRVSIVVAVRNEEMNITRLINNLLQQDYPSQLYEIIIVDDHSTDRTVRLAEEIIERQKNSSHLRIIELSGNTGSGKKAALSLGIRETTGELIVITDADCSAGKQWISSITAFYCRFRPKMILGPVRMTHGSNLFLKLQSLEFMSLIASAAGSCNAGFPILANGANITFTREAYQTCGGFTGNLQYPSGDDIFLMMSIKNIFGSKSIRFLHSEKAIIDTPATTGLKPFFQQRLRWVSKSSGYKDPLLITASILVFVTNVWLVFSAMAAVFSPDFFRIFLVLYTIKLLIDFPLMFSYSRFQRSVPLLWFFPLMELLNAGYTFFIGIAGNIWKYEWKDRKS